MSSHMILIVPKDSRLGLSLKQKSPEATRFVSCAGKITPAGKGESEEHIEIVQEGKGVDGSPLFQAWISKNGLGSSRCPFPIFYHGTPCWIDAFDTAFQGLGNDEAGSGFYFTSAFEDAEHYSLKGGDGIPGKWIDFPNVVAAYVNIRKPIDMGRDDYSLSERHAEAIIRRSPILEEALDNWGSEDDPKRMQRAVEAYSFKDGNLVKRLWGLANDFYPDSDALFLRELHAVTGYDGVINKSKSTVAVAFFPEQIIRPEAEVIALGDSSELLTFSLSRIANFPGGVKPADLCAAFPDLFSKISKQWELLDDGLSTAESTRTLAHLMASAFSSPEIKPEFNSSVEFSPR